EERDVVEIRRELEALRELRDVVAVAREALDADRALGLDVAREPEPAAVPAGEIDEVRILSAKRGQAIRIRRRALARREELRELEEHGRRPAPRRLQLGDRVFARAEHSEGFLDLLVVGDELVDVGDLPLDARVLLSLRAELFPLLLIEE